MSLSAPTIGRALSLIVLAVVTALAGAGPAFAHGGTGGASSDYRIAITGYTVEPVGFEMRIVELGNRVELHRTTADEVTVLGYSGEPYLRLGPDGVFENVNSPAHYLNLDRFASTSPPSGVTADGEPSWARLTSGDTVRWHDHRVHWMSPLPPASVQAEPGREQVVHTDHVDLVVDGRPVAAMIEITWLPPPERVVWLSIAGVLGAGVAALFVLVKGAKRWMPAMAVVAAIASAAGQGASPARWVIAGCVLAVAVAGLALRKPVICIAGACAAGLLAATRIEVFEHQLLAGAVPAAIQRVAIVIALAVGLGITAAAIVDALSPSAESSHAEE